MSNEFIKSFAGQLHDECSSDNMGKGSMISKSKRKNVGHNLSQ